LELDADTARGMQQGYVRPSEDDVLQGPVEERFAHGAKRALELGHARIGRHPARLEMRSRHAGVIASEKTEEVLREILLVHLGERAHDAEVERDIAALGRHQDVSRMHVRVKETVAEHLSEEDLDASARE